MLPPPLRTNAVHAGRCRPSRPRSDRIGGQATDRPEGARGGSAVHERRRTPPGRCTGASCTAPGTTCSSAAGTDARQLLGRARRAPPAGGATATDHHRHRQAGRVERWVGRTEAGVLVGHGHPLRPALLPPARRQTLPAVVADVAAQELLGRTLRVVGQQRRAVRPPVRPRDRCLVAADRGDELRRQGGGAEGDQPAEAVADDRRGPPVQDRHEVGDVGGQVAGARGPGTAVAAAVVAHDRLGRERLGHPGEARVAVHRAVHQHHRRPVPLGPPDVQPGGAHTLVTRRGPARSWRGRARRRRRRRGRARPRGSRTSGARGRAGASANSTAPMV